MKRLETILKNFHSKEWWIKELKEISWTEILLLIAFILCYMQVRQINEIAKDPCNFCVIHQGDYSITCKEYFKSPYIYKYQRNFHL
jgi:hypothetical protein